ncbi:MAG TPA: Smr/MutS family protein [Vicinamibacterales bacterium]
MHPGALRALEFDRIVSAVSGLAQTPMGEARLEALEPSTDASAVARRLAATSETTSFLIDNRIALQAAPEFDAILEGLSVEGRPLEPGQLLAVASFLSSVDVTANAIRRARMAFPILRGIADSTASFTREINEVRSKIDPAGDVSDDASPELKSIRERLRKQRARLRGTLESYLRGKDTAKYLQQQVVTDRNGRYVLVVRAEHRSAIPGIVHGSSGTGASLYLEPLSTVEINNDIVALEQQEKEEVHRILVALTDLFRGRGPEMQATVDAATELDVLQAKANFSLMIDGTQPKIAADGRLELRAARHPLLIESVRRRLGDSANSADSASSPDPAPRTADPAPRTPDSVPSPDRGPRTAHSGTRTADRGPRTADRGHGPVPVDILLIPPTSVLVITGPNTGGKTVALKTAGLLPLMAQAGILIPVADGSQIPVFKCVFADIGDDQSIAANLSTFSSHIRNIVEMNDTLDLPALILLDEPGAGTDPMEGGALAMAIIDHFRRRGATVVATTHYDSLKTYAATTEGVVPAGFGFDPQTFAPTYRLNYGSPGSSLALEIATRLGLPASIIDEARTHRSERESQLAEHLARVEKDMQALEHERRLAARERQTLSETAAKLQSREADLRNREETFKRRLDERIEERLREARREIDAVVEKLKVRTETLASQAEHRAARLVPTGQSGGARAEARAAIDAIGQRLRSSSGDTAAAAAPVPAQTRPAAAGDRVVVGALGLEGIVQSIHDGTADVDVRGKRLRAKIDDLRVVTPASAQTARVRVNLDLQPRSGSITELNLIGNTVDEALTRLEKFLDEAMISDSKSFRIVHGFGTGQLRRAVAEFLKTHPLVAHYGPAPENQGGGGATVVELKE